jgi:histidine triad (HIT) family protein
MEDCAFCDIVAGTAPSSIVYDDDVVMAFLDIQPVNPGHTLVIPKRHYAGMAEMDEETGMHLFKITVQIAQAIRESGVQCEGINLFVADGEAAFQDVFHVHIHVLPRFSGDSFKIDADRGDQPSRSELDRVARLIRDATRSQSRPPQ